MKCFAKNKIFSYLNKFAKISLTCDKSRDFVALFNSFLDFVNFGISKTTKYDFVDFVTIIVNRFSIFVLTIFKIFRIFGNFFSRSFVKIFDKQKTFVFVFVRFVRRV